MPGLPLMLSSQAQLVAELQPAAEVMGVLVLACCNRPALLALSAQSCCVLPGRLLLRAGSYPSPPCTGPQLVVKDPCSMQPPRGYHKHM
jgi:hypothetical protein